MSRDYFVHFEKHRAVGLDQWRASVSKLGYPLILPDELDPRAPAGATDCRYGNDPVVVGFFLDDDPELPSPFPKGAERMLMQFNFNATAGEITQHAALAAAASFCIATGGVIDDNTDEISAKRAKVWAKGNIQEDDEMTERALAYPHPDEEPPDSTQAPRRSWWRLW